MFGWFKKMILRMRGCECTNCAHWMTYRFAVGDCDLEKFFSLCGHVGKGRVCEKWVPNIVLGNKRLTPKEVALFIELAKANGYCLGDEIPESEVFELLQKVRQAEKLVKDVK